MSGRTQQSDTLQQCSLRTPCLGKIPGQFKCAGRWFAVAPHRLLSPLAGGMAAAWPYCDAVVSAHRLDALGELTAALADPGPRPPPRPRPRARRV